MMTLRAAGQNHRRRGLRRDAVPGPIVGADFVHFLVVTSGAVAALVLSI